MIVLAFTISLVLLAYPTNLALGASSTTKEIAALQKKILTLESSVNSLRSQLESTSARIQELSKLGSSSYIPDGYRESTITFISTKELIGGCPTGSGPSGWDNEFTVPTRLNKTYGNFDKYQALQICVMKILTK